MSAGDSFILEHLKKWLAARAAPLSKSQRGDQLEEGYRECAVQALEEIARLEFKA